jgi:hypothetical protein
VQKTPLLLLLILAACASRTKTLDRLVGTSIDDLLPKWEEPKAIIDLQAGQKAYTYVKVNAQSKSFILPVGDKYTRYSSDIFYMYTVVTTDSTGTILSWEAISLDTQLDSVGLVNTFRLNPE